MPDSPQKGRWVGQAHRGVHELVGRRAAAEDGQDQHDDRAGERAHAARDGFELAFVAGVIRDGCEVLSEHPLAGERQRDEVEDEEDGAGEEQDGGPVGRAVVCGGGVGLQDGGVSTGAEDAGSELARGLAG